MADKIKLWSVNGNEEWTPIEGRASKTLNPGLYELNVIPPGFTTPGRVFLKPMKIQSDEILSLPGSLTEYIVQLLDTFWKNRPRYDAMGLLHKRGILLEGDPGSGKTAIVLLTGRAIAERGGVAVFTASTTQIGPLPGVLQTIREVQPDIPILNIIEDLDKHGHNIERLLPMLDGETQISGVVHLATTNYLERMDARITARPSRFDEVIKVKPPIKVTRRAYFNKRLPDDFGLGRLEKLVDVSSGLHYAQLKELAICAYLYDRDPVETTKRLKNMTATSHKGFAPRERDDDEDDN